MQGGSRITAAAEPQVPPWHLRGQGQKGLADRGSGGLSGRASVDRRMDQLRRRTGGGGCPLGRHGRMMLFPSPCDVWCSGTQTGGRLPEQRVRAPSWLPHPAAPLAEAEAAHRPAPCSGVLFGPLLGRQGHRRHSGRGGQLRVRPRRSRSRRRRPLSDPELRAAGPRRDMHRTGLFRKAVVCRRDGRLTEAVLSDAQFRHVRPRTQGAEIILTTAEERC